MVYLIGGSCGGTGTIARRCGLEYDGTKADSRTTLRLGPGRDAGVLVRQVWLVCGIFRAAIRKPDPNFCKTCLIIPRVVIGPRSYHASPIRYPRLGDAGGTSLLFCADFYEEPPKLLSCLPKLRRSHKRPPPTQIGARSRTVGAAPSQLAPHTRPPPTRRPAPPQPCPRRSQKTLRHTEPLHPTGRNAHRITHHQSAPHPTRGASTRAAT